MPGSTEPDPDATAASSESTNMRERFHVAWLSDLQRTAAGRVEPQWIDSMGHMNVMWYTHVFSQANLGFLRSIGMDLPRIRDQGRGVFALETHLRYFSEALVGHTWQVHTRIIGRSARCIHLLHFMTIDDNGRLSATCEHITAYADTSARRTAVLPAAWADPIDALIRHHQRLAWHPPLCGSMGIRSPAAT